MNFRKVIYSGVCLCGHEVNSHHCCCVMNKEAYEVMGPILPDTCCAYGSNEDEGLDENGNDHCFGYVDKDDPDPARVARWVGTKR